MTGDGTYSMEESVGVTTVTFTGLGVSTGYDPNNSDIPIGGLIVSVGSSSGFGYQPLVAAGGTVTIDASGQVSKSIANSGSGYRVGIQTVVNVGVQTDGEPSLQFIGTTKTISGGHIVSVAVTNPGTGYTSTNPPELVFDDPHSYDNIPVQYSSSGPTGGW